MLPGLITAPLGGEYMLADPGALDSTNYRYRLIEVETNTVQNTYGPSNMRLNTIER